METTIETICEEMDDLILTIPIGRGARGLARKIRKDLQELSAE